MCHDNAAVVVFRLCFKPIKNYVDKLVLLMLDMQSVCSACISCRLNCQVYISVYFEFEN